MKTIPLNNSKELAIVDDDDFERVSAHKWIMNGPGYVSSWINGEQVFLHRFIMGAKKGQEIDHINCDKLDCRKENLRFCTHSQNLANGKARVNNKLGVKGVDCNQGKYRATIRVNYKKIFIGYFETLKDAGLAYNLASRKYFGEFGFQNDVSEL